MALSNIFREPRREITETAVGILWLGGSFALGYYVSLWLHLFDDGSRIVMGVCVGTIIFASPFVLIGIAHFTHSIGELACQMLKSIGLDPRPRRRY